MSEEKTNDDAPQISDEQLDEVAAGDGKTWKGTSLPMGWDNTKHVKWSDSGISSSEPEEEPPADLTRKE